MGLLGGSFNPAHDGHRRISIEALKRLRLDQIWWLVTPQNPLKASDETAPMLKRLARAREVARHPRIVVTDIEKRLRTHHTVHTVERLRARFPDHRFVWLMGADNLVGLHRWYRWDALVRGVPIAVFDREPYVHAALAGKAARVFERARWRAALDELASAEPPAWCLLRLRTHPAASSAIRAAGRWRKEPLAEEA